MPEMHSNPVRDIPHYLMVFQNYLGMRIYLIFALTLVAALAEGVGIVMLLPLLQVLDRSNGVLVTTDAQAAIDTSHPDAVPDAGIIGFIQDLLINLGLADSTVSILVIITVAFVIKGGLTFCALGLNAFLRGKLARELKGRMFDHYSRMSYAYYSSRDTGYFINVINGQINTTLAAFNALTMLGGQLVITVIYLGLAFAVAWRFGLMALMIGISLLLLFRWLNVFVRDLSRKTAIEEGHLSSLLIQALHAFKYLTATGQIAPLRGTINATIGRLVDFQIRTGVATAFTNAIREPIAVVFIMVIMLVQLVFLQQPLAPILVSILLFYRGLNAVLGIQGYWQSLLAQVGSLEMVGNEFAAQCHHQEPDAMQLAPQLSRSIHLDDVHFSYDPKLGDVLKGISLEIPARTSVALVGESGAGKSTLVDLLTLMLKPRQGRVLIDGVPGEALQLATWRLQIGYVSQETVVFDDSIANNICMWAGDTVNDRSLLGRVHEAARQAHIDHFVERLPDGYQTQVGDRGLRLSGGQRQRLFIARELFRKPNLLILDEATSALDSASERAIQQSIDALKGVITVVIIAHRLSTIRNVDYVYVFEQGRLVEQGPYWQLRDAENTRFGKMIAIQAT